MIHHPRRKLTADFLPPSANLVQEERVHNEDSYDHWTVAAFISGVSG